MLYIVKRLRLAFIAAGVVLLALAACRSFGWVSFGDVAGFALAGFACWLASTT